VPWLLWVVVYCNRWLMGRSRSVGTPFNVQHRTHVDTEFKWSGQDLEKTVTLTTKLGEGMSLSYDVMSCRIQFPI
jgi:hypothetical protein